MKTKKNFLVEETRGKDKVFYSVSVSESFRSLKELFFEAWHPTKIIGEVSDEDTKRLEELESKTNGKTCVEDDPNFINLLKLKAEENTLNYKKNKIEKRLKEIATEKANFS